MVFQPVAFERSSGVSLFSLRFLKSLFFAMRRCFISASRPSYQLSDQGIRLNPYMMISRSPFDHSFTEPPLVRSTLNHFVPDAYSTIYSSTDRCAFQDLTVEGFCWSNEPGLHQEHNYDVYVLQHLLSVPLQPLTSRDPTFTGRNQANSYCGSYATAIQEVAQPYIAPTPAVTPFSWPSVGSIIPKFFSDPSFGSTTVLARPRVL